MTISAQFLACEQNQDACQEGKAGNQPEEGRYFKQGWSPPGVPVQCRRGSIEAKAFPEEEREAAREASEEAGRRKAELEAFQERQKEST